MGDDTVSSPAAPHRSTPVELKERYAAERGSAPFLLLRDDRGEQRIVILGQERERMSLGRGDENDVALPWDARVSRLHAELERLGGEWTIADDGLSRNGTFVNGARLAGRYRLRDGDAVRAGETTLLYRDPTEPVGATDLGGPGEVKLTDAQRRVLVALCAPYKHGDRFAAPASNQAIADQLVLSIEAVKTHMKTLFEKLELGDLPRQEKRIELARRALEWGVVTQRELP
jgi:pSer/pThr/pTyr-binding forkhead associated (FHA) protein